MMNAVWRIPPGTCLFTVSEGWRLVNALAKNPMQYRSLNTRRYTWSISHSMAMVGCWIPGSNSALLLT